MEIAASIRPRAGVLAVQDRIIVGYMATVAVLLWARSPAGPLIPVFWQILATIAVVLGAAYLHRAVPQVPRFVRVNLYRVVIVVAILWGYLMLHDVLPIVRTDSVDGTLAAIDQRLFGGQPVLWMERFNHRGFIEWMSFFYFNHYTLLLAMTVGAVWISGDRRVAAEFGIGTALVFCIGHLGYMAVPAYGPYKFFAERFAGPIDGATFWNLVATSVASSGAQKDVFPSLHTGGSTWCAFFAIHQAMLDKRWRIPAAVAAFFAANIVVSTIVLRWHYAIDVMAGLTLSTTTVFTAWRIARWEEKRRAEQGLPPVWPTE
jgi:membrane-associated phospholipid phosphatase